MTDKTRLPPIETNSVSGLSEALMRNVSQAQGFVGMVMAQVLNGVQASWPDAFESSGPAWVNASLYDKDALEVVVTAHITARIDGREIRIEVQVP